MGRGASISATSTMHAQPTVKFEWLLPLVKEKTKSTSLKSETLHGYKNVGAHIPKSFISPNRLSSEIQFPPRAVSHEKCDANPL